MPYELLVDGAASARATMRAKYLLSPQDLCAFDLMPELADAGVSCFKIEGRMKGPEYVADVVDKYRRALDAAIEQRAYPLTAEDEEELRYSFSRGFSHGFLGGSDHQKLVHAKFPGHRGVLVGRVDEVQAKSHRVLVAPERPDAPDALSGVARGEAARPSLKAGDWILFDQGKPEDDEPRGGLHACDVLPDGRLKLVFGSGHGDGSGPDLRLVRPGDLVWKAKDAELTRRAKRIAAQERKVDLALEVKGRAGGKLVVSARDALGRTAQVESSGPLALAQGTPLDEALLRDKLGAFGETPFALRTLSLELEGALWLSPGELKKLRRALVEALLAQPAPREQRTVTRGHAAPELVAPPPALAESAARAPLLVPLLRTFAQVEQAIALAPALGLNELELDFMELVGLGRAVEAVRAAGLRATIATPRVQKPGEEAYDQRFERLRPDGILARHLGALEQFRSRAPGDRERTPGFVVRGDFSLNATNALTARTLLSLGLTTLTPAYDLDLAQLLESHPRRRRCPAGSDHPPAPAPLPQRALRLFAPAQRRQRLQDVRTPLRGAPARAQGSERPRPSGDRRRRLPEHRLQRPGAERGQLLSPAAGGGRAPLPRRVRPRERRGDQDRPARLRGAAPRRDEPARDHPRGGRAGEVRRLGRHPGGDLAAARVGPA